MNIVLGFSLLFSVVAIVYYFIEKKKSATSIYKQLLIKNIDNYIISNDDIILVELANENSTAIMWNSKPDLELSGVKVAYQYNIKDQKDGNLIASGSSKTTNGIHKIKNIPILKGHTYIVTIIPSVEFPNISEASISTNHTTVTIPFFPITIVDQKIYGDELDITTDISPTNLQIYSKDGNLLPNSQSNIKIEPPGITSKIKDLDKEELIILLYNGKNAGTLWIFNQNY